MISLSGHVNRPGNYELPHGITWRQLFEEVGSGIRNGNELKMWIPGGASRTLVHPEEHLDLESRSGRRHQLDARIGRGDRHGRDHVVGAGRRAGRALLRPRVMRRVHAVPGRDVVAPR